ncbi:MAG: bifunctional 4-hydroxy-2-oxoglutarate aldolase/2-dehydro-3-deoxy-phosphogluconate aldolase [Candidatus Omnitrophica bacterium]|nr:bifunctional 4-hydroxy-2-oxoglutarate aldolase/2-dehydro-3-deoxy-phosphogluconate aldolase [Candidatus Omnitrophota bacterium]MDD5487508.1 bifunctional 4-hydroxy-2-oxoglutarate aldolase/2-dehydro-3-deoxy-phosphogluconate aldolase [Candidatus Omnitrophota bacterium]
MRFDLERFAAFPLMAIVRGIPEDAVEPLIETAVSSGIKTLEVTMNTGSAADMIRKIIDMSGKELMIGAGTVTSRERLETALDAGAGFIVTPVVDEGIIGECVKRGISVFPGALTPGEVFKAWSCGASMVKIFPSGLFGPGYMKELKGPFNDVRLMAVGGVRPANIAEYAACGADAVAFGSSVFKKELIDKKDFRSIGGMIKEYVASVNNAFAPGRSPS